VNVPFLDLARQHSGDLGAQIRDAIERVMRKGRFILGEEVEFFEAEFAYYVGAKHCIACSSGTDAIELAVRACGLERESIAVPALTAWGTVAGVIAAGAHPDVRDVIERAPYGGMMLLPASEPVGAAIPVALWGRSCNRGSARATIIDACQGAGIDWRHDLTRVSAVCFSFYPTKNLGAMGDGGAVCTNDDNLADEVRLLHVQGERVRFKSERRVGHSRLDEVQAAILRIKLPRLDEWTKARRAILRRYYETLGGGVYGLSCQWPKGETGCNGHLAVLYADDRNKFRAHMTARGIETAVHYPVPIHLMPAIGGHVGECPNAEDLCRHVVSIPCYPEMEPGEVDAVCEALAAWKS
jgi:dTDP-3-amino-3,4,6-trideoxy-alpha-D-glucose transaminase